MGTTSPKAVIMDETAVNRAMTRIAHEILERNEGCEDLALVGIVTRGDLLAKKLAEAIKEIDGHDFPQGGHHGRDRRQPSDDPHRARDPRAQRGL